MPDDKVVAITGAGSGIGAACARVLAKRGMKVVLGSRGSDALDAVAEQVIAGGGEAATIAIDVTVRHDLTRLVGLAQQRFGRLDVLISNAGAMPIGPLDDLAIDDWERMIDVNLKGVLYGIAAALPVFRNQGSGHFVNIASTAARKVTPNQAVYAATKAAVAALSDGLRQEVAGELRVTALFPGFTDTKFASHVKNEEVKRALQQSGERFSMDADRVAAAVAFAIEQPADVNIGEIVLRSIAQP